MPAFEPGPPASFGFNPESLSTSESVLTSSLNSSLAANGTTGIDAGVTWVRINKGCAGFSVCDCTVDSAFRASSWDTCCCNRASIDGCLGGGFSELAACSFFAAPRKDRVGARDVGDVEGDADAG